MTESLSKKVEKWIESGGLKDQLDLIMECISNGSSEAMLAVQRMTEDMYGGYTYNYELKARGATGLLYWGEQGLEALKESAFRTPTSKNLQIAVTTLASLAAGTELDSPVYYGDGKVKELIRQKHSAESLGSKARELLRTIFLDMDDEDDIYLTASSSMTSLTLINREAALEVFRALSAKHLALSHQVLMGFEEIINNEPNSEPTLHSYIERYPQLLDPMVFQFWSKPVIHGAKIPDFILRRRDDTYVIVEIETPSKKVITKDNQLTAEATRAVTQAVDYRSFLLDRISEARKYFPELVDPECLVLIGLEKDLNATQKQALVRENSSRHNVRIVGFDWLLKRGDSILENVIIGGIVSPKVRMI